jgi:RecB family endonuclease NucS
MSSIKLFRTISHQVEELTAKSIALEKSLQTLFEANLEIFLGVRFLATEYSTGVNHKGRIDTLGLDENNCPVIIEYKRSSNENIINQGLFYLNWLLDHKAEFELLVQKKISIQDAENIEWASPRVLCIAGDFTRYDEHAVHEIGKTLN